VYRWISGESEPDFNSIRMLLRKLPSRDAQAAILSAFVAGTPWCVSAIECDLDVNQDGKVDVNDALDACIRSVQPASESLIRLRHACRENNVTAEACVRLIALLHDVMRHSATCEQVLTRVAERRKKIGST
jgi:hypothetical protein